MTLHCSQYYITIEADCMCVCVCVCVGGGGGGGSGGSHSAFEGFPVLLHDIYDAVYHNSKQQWTQYNATCTSIQKYIFTQTIFTLTKNGGIEPPNPHVYSPAI